MIWNPAFRRFSEFLFLFLYKEPFRTFYPIEDFVLTLADFQKSRCRLSLDKILYPLTRPGLFARPATVLGTLPDLYSDLELFLGNSQTCRTHGAVWFKADVKIQGPFRVSRLYNLQLLVAPIRVFCPLTLADFQESGCRLSVGVFCFSSRDPSWSVLYDLRLLLWQLRVFLSVCHCFLNTRRHSGIYVPI